MKPPRKPLKALTSDAAIRRETARLLKALNRGKKD